jgi:4-amino-4-deoxy-L-arabinose transferase-like glycosyltransferase
MWSVLVRLLAALLAFIAAMAVTRLGPPVLGRTERLALELGAWGCALLLLIGAAWIVSIRGPRARR